VEQEIRRDLDSLLQEHHIVLVINED